MDRSAITILVLGTLAGCSCDDVVDPGSDGNVIISDARTDSGADLGVSDSGGEDGFVDGGPDAADLDGAMSDATHDAGEADAAPEDAGDQCSEAATANLTTGQAVANLAMYVGQIVIVEGTANPGTTRCTSIACGPADPCCNTCSAPVELDQALPLLASPCIAPGCNGDDCGLVCRPPVLGVPGHYKGRLIDSNGAALELYQVLP